MAKPNMFPYARLRPQGDGSFRPRFVTGPRERELGFADRDLRHDDGRWFTLDEASAWLRAKQQEIAAARLAGKAAPAPAPKGRTVEDLLRAWLASRDVTDLAASTQDGYRKNVNAVVYEPGQDDTPMDRRAREDFAREPIAAIGKPEAKAFFEYLREARGHHMALACIAVLRAACTWGETSIDWRLKANPFLKLKLPRPQGRIVIYTDAELRHVIATADAIGRASMGDAIMLGLYSGQRQGDRLALEDGGLVDGRRQLRQGKTGVVVAIPETPSLRARLEAARLRVSAIKLKFKLKERPPQIIIDETTGRPYNEHTYRHVFAEIRARAAKDCPSLAGKRDQDLRDTAVTWLARAGCTVPEIGAITGHSPQSIYQVLKHYLAITPELADAAIAKLVAWMDREGMAV